MNAQLQPKPVLSDNDAALRMRLLAALHDALDGRGIQSLLARTHRLVLRYNESPCPPSGLTNPILHIFMPGGMVAVTTDGRWYVLPGSSRCNVSDPAAAADAVALAHRTAAEPLI